MNLPDAAPARPSRPGVKPAGPAGPAAPAQPRWAALLRPGPSTRVLGVFSGIAITVSIAVMLVISLAGPSSAVVTASSPGLAPPWWIPLPLPVALVTIALWVAVILGTAGVAAGLAAAGRGARFPVRLVAGGAIGVSALFAVLPAAGSSDTLDYASYGRMVVLGDSPYQMTPHQLRGLGDPVGLQAPGAWAHVHSDYGPLTTVEQAAAAELGGTATGRIIFWLKLWNAAAFCLVVVVLDRLLRADPVRRARAHLLWSANPLLLWGLVAAGHVDAVAAACGLLGLALVRWRPGEQASVPHYLLAGALAGAAADFKITYALFGLGLAWAARRSLTALVACAAGALAVLVPSYLWFGPPAVKVLSDHRDATPDTLYRFFGHSFLHPDGAEVALVVLPIVVALAIALLRRVPSGFPALPAVHPAFMFTLAWTLAWPYQRPWYDAALLCVLALYPASRLDWLIIGQLGITTFEFIPGMPSFPPLHSWLQWALDEQVTLVVPAARLAALLAAAALCCTGAWYARRHEQPQLAGAAPAR